MSVDFNRNVYCLLGLPFDALDMTDAVARVHAASVEKVPCFLSTPNLNFLIASHKDPEFRASVLRSDLSIADGAPLAWMARFLGMPIRERVAGSSLFEILRNTPDHPLSIYFFGGPPGVAERAGARLNAEASAMTCAGFECPGFGSIEDMSSDQTIDRINASGADFLVVALGAKKGQAWIMRNRARLTVPIVSHLGAVVNFVAGTVTRAPVWMQRRGLEWLWRIKEEPGLWKRYWRDGLDLVCLIITRALPYAWYRGRYPLANAELVRASVTMAEDGGVSLIRLEGAWIRDNLAPLRQYFSLAAQCNGDIRLDVAGVTHVDSAFVGLLMLLHGYQLSRGAQLLIYGMQKRVRRIFELSCAEYMLQK